jgi:hypothetical protein
MEGRYTLHEGVFRFPVFTLQLGISGGVVGLDVQETRIAARLTLCLAKRQLHFYSGLVPDMGTALRR